MPSSQSHTHKRALLFWESFAIKIIDNDSFLVLFGIILFFRGVQEAILVIPFPDFFPFGCFILLTLVKKNKYRNIKVTWVFRNNWMIRKESFFWKTAHWPKCCFTFLLRNRELQSLMGKIWVLEWNNFFGFYDRFGSFFEYSSIWGSLQGPISREMVNSKN